MEFRNQQEKYRKENNITGGYYKFNLCNCLIGEKESCNKIHPMGLILDASPLKRYHVLYEVCTWTLLVVDEDKDHFYKEHGTGKGRHYNYNAWDILNELKCGCFHGCGWVCTRSNDGKRIYPNITMSCDNIKTIEDYKNAEEF